VTTLLLEHPAIRHARAVRLSTRDAQGVYAALGFIDVKSAPLRPWPYTDMALLRARRPGPARA
jgi:hypothetical protein